MSSEVETPLAISDSRRIQRSSTPLGMTKPRTPAILFADLTVCYDENPLSAAMNMAIDEALLEMGNHSNYPLLSLEFTCPIVWIFWDALRCGDLRGGARFGSALDWRRHRFARRRPHLLGYDSGERSGV